MIKLYNDTTSAAWRLSNANSKGVSRISGGKKVDNAFQGVTIPAPAEGMIESAFETKQSNKLVTAYEGNTSIHYGKYDNMPNIGTNGTNKDIYLIAKDIRGCRIKDITRQDVFIFSYKILKGVLYMIMSVKDTCETFEITLHNTSAKEDITTTFNLKTGETTSKVVTGTSEPEMFRIRAFRPSRYTTAIIYNVADEGEIDPKILNDEKHVFFTYTSDDDYGTAISQALDAGYSAITLYTSLEEVLNNDFGKYDDVVTYMRTAFAQVNIVLGGLPSPKILKR